MRALGYRYGEHFVTESRGPGGNPDRLPALAAELVHLKPDVLIAGGGLPAVALKQATTTIPFFSKAPSPAICRWSCRPSSSCSSTLKTARVLGINVPQVLLLLRANEVIQ